MQVVFNLLLEVMSLGTSAFKVSIPANWAASLATALTETNLRSSHKSVPSPQNIGLTLLPDLIITSRDQAITCDRKGLGSKYLHGNAICIKTATTSTTKI